MRTTPTALILLLFVASSARSSVAQEVEFARDVQPILAARCYRCHGEKRQRGGLRLDLAPRAASGAGFGSADSGLALIVPGRPGESELIRRVTSDDVDDLMPALGDPLRPEQIEVLVRWIESGAVWPRDGQREESQHWAYRPPVRPQPPSVRASTWVRNPIDRFVLARLEAKGLTPSAQAERETLLRRVSLDLTGLPPALDEIQAFLLDTSGDAYERCVDRLLASPHYGERWARHWLDLARYADSHGFTVDGKREIWPYRDWVIDALNADMPFDRFSIEQLAGDLLQGATREQLIATGFQRNSQINQENGVDEEEFRIEAVKDRVQTMSATWLGTTLQCAQCHSHKYDPISHADYYRLFAFFNQTEDSGGMQAALLGPKLELPTPAERTEIERIESEMLPLQARLDEWSPELERAQRQWERDSISSQDDWVALVPAALSSVPAGALSARPLLIEARDERPPSAVYRVVCRTELSRISAIRLEVLPDPRIARAGPGRARGGDFVLTGISLSALPLFSHPKPLTPRPVELVRPAASFFASGADGSWPPGAALDGDDRSGWAIAPQFGRAHVAVFELADALEFEGGVELFVTLEQKRGDGSTFGRFRLAVTSRETPVGGLLRTKPGMLAAMKLPPDRRSAAQGALLKSLFQRSYSELISARRVLESLAGTRPRPVTTLVMRELDTRRPTHVLRGGSFLRPGLEVQPDVPGFLPPLAAANDPPTRLDLARWLFRPDHPLTFRVTVNRLWQRLFGRGLVETENDFGTRGSAPSHPDLLDWLALEFLERGLSIKALQRLIVTSATYRQASVQRAELRQVDPRNRLLGRQNRLRFDAETIRDAALVASGLLCTDIGGPPVFPPQPPGVFRSTQKAKQWITSEGCDRFRRTLYTFHWRSTPHPFLTTFDAPPASVTCTRRLHSNTPLQALSLANDPMLIELAQGLAGRVLALDAESDTERLRHAFLWCLGRAAQAGEVTLMLEFLERNRQAFSGRPAAARELAPPESQPGVDPARAAAWVALARTLLNLDEFVTRG